MRSPVGSRFQFPLLTMTAAATLVLFSVTSFSSSSSSSRAEEPAPASAKAPPPPAPAVTVADTFLRDYAETRGFMLGRPVGATPTPDGGAVLFLRAHGPRDPSQELYEFNVSTGKSHLLLSPDAALKGAAEQLSPEEKARRERQRISVGGFTAFSISNDSALVLLSLSGKLYVLQRADGKVTELATLPGTIVDPKFSPDSRRVAYVRDQDVCVFDLAAGKEHAVSTGGSETISHGQAEFVAQEELDRFSGYWWSPDSAQIVYQENDASKVESWYPSDPAQPGNPPERSFYPRPGKDNVSVRLGIVSAAASGGGGDGGASPAKTVWLEWDRARYPYLGKVTWTKYGPLTLTVLSRDQTQLALLQVEPATGKTSTLLTEQDPAWINLHQDVPRWLSPESGFLWITERNGQLQLERHGPDGQAADVLTRPEDGFLSLAGVAGGHAFVTETKGNPEVALPVDVPLHSEGQETEGTAAPIATNAGLFTLAFGESESVFALKSETPSTLPKTEVWRAGTSEPLGELPSIALEPPFRVKLDFVELAASDIGGQQEKSFHTVIVRPRDFGHAAAGKKYPVIVDVYAGPGYQHVLAGMGRYLLDQWLADQGYIVVAIDGRGTPGRSRGWERAIAGHFGSVPLDDQVAALKLLGVKYPELDLERVGITGWSFGGYMSALAVLRRPDVFNAAVAGAPVVDWLDYDTCYTERYLGVPGAGRYPDAYKEGSLLTYAEGLSRPLLLIHGTADDNVYFRHSLRLVQALFRAGKPFEFLPLSGFTHMVPDPVVRARLEERIVRHFNEHLQK